MPQTNMSFVAKNPANVNAPLTVDANGNLFTGQGSASRLNLSVATVVKATSGRLVKIVVGTVPTAGALVASDVATTGAVGAANQIVSIAFGSLTAGQVINLDWPCAVGIVVNPGAGGVISVSYD